MLAANLVLRTQLAEIDASISELRLRLLVLQRARGPIKKQLDRIVYPVLSLPPEITSEIFLECLPPHPLFAPFGESGLTNSVAPLLLLQVCKTWRKIALSTPRLWDSLHLFHSAGFPRTSTMAKVITDWFGRARSSPLTLSLSVSDNWLASDTGATVLSTILSPLAPRLKSMWLDFERAAELADIGPFPMLETLIVSYRPLDDAEPPQKLFSAAPRLHRLIFIEDAKPAMFILPQALSKVTCERSITAEELLNLLRDAPFLQQLSCDISDHVSSRTWETTPHDCLETLDSNLHPVLKCLRLPALQTLHLSDGQEATAGYFPAFISSSTHLRHFSATSIRPMSVAWFATAMPGLESIDLCDPPQPFLSQFFARLDRTKDSRFLPHLRALVFREGSLRLPRSRRSHPDAQRATIPLFLDPSSSSGLTGKSLPSMILIQTGPGILLGAIPGS